MSLKKFNKMPPREKAAAIAIAVIAVGLMAFLVRNAIVAGHGPKYDEHGCPVEGVKGHLLFVIDRTDPLSPSKHRAIVNEIKLMIQQVEQGYRISVYEIDAKNMKGLSEPVYSECKPRSGKDADPLTENPQLLARKYEENFVQPLETVLERYSGGEEQPRSPIIESLIDVVHIEDFGSGVPNRKLVLFSDMLQHSSLLSHYSGGPSFERGKSKPGFTQMIPHLPGVEVTVFYMLRDTPRVRALQSNEHVRFWVDLFDAAGADLQKIAKIK